MGTLIRIWLVMTVGAALCATSVAATAVPRVPGTVAGSVRYALDEPLCAHPANPRAARCYALRRVEVPKGTAGATAYVQPASIGLGPAGGYNPDDLAAAYGYDPATAASGQVIGIVNWHDDPHVLSDLDTFDATYGLPRESATSFRKVNQNGTTAPLPAADSGTAGEIALDVEAARGVCHGCRILLVEASSSSDGNLAAAEDRAVAMGATEVSNGFGEPEHPLTAGVLAAYNHPGVVITAPSGDDGWFGWDRANNTSPPNASQNAASFPATDPDVIAVGGTTLELNANGTRGVEQVWNENGSDDQTGQADAAGQGATGGGCSTLYRAQPWQAAYAGYAAAGCNGRRLAADVSAIADPQLGFDVYDSYGQSGWTTMGGTSLAATVVAGMFALRGGAGGTAYPAATLYVNGTHRASSLFDVISGGNSFCGGDTTASCGGLVFSNFGMTTHSPNALGAGNVDCSFPRNTADPPSPPPRSSECNAVAGYDGASGLGTPNGISLFTPTAPTVSLVRPASLRLRRAATFRSTAVEPVAGAHVTSYAWSWGDATRSSTSSTTTTHTYTRAGSYTVTLTLTDSLHQVVMRTTRITVGKKPSVHYSGPRTVKRKHKARFSAVGTRAVNTGSRILKVAWKWGDGHKSTGVKARHSYSRAGTFTITLTVTDSTGVSAIVRKKVKVKKS